MTSLTQPTGFGETTLIKKEFSLNKYKNILPVICLLFCFTSLPAQSVNIPLNHWSYAFLERLETQHKITGVMNSTRPMTRQEMAGYLVPLIQKVHSGTTQLNSVEAEQLAFLKIEFREELDSLLPIFEPTVTTRISRLKKMQFIDPLLPDFLYRNDRNFLNFSHEQFRIFIDPILYRDAQFATTDTLAANERVYQDANGFTFWGALGDHLGFFFDARDTKEWGTRTYSTQHKITREGLGFVNGYGTHIYHDETVAYLVFRLPYFNLTLGKDENKWGPGERGNLALSDYATSYDQLKFSVNYWRFKFTSLTAFLRPYPDVIEQDQILSKGMAAHRLEINLWKYLQIGLHETVIYGGRRLEPAYLNPLMFYRSAEHYLSNEDNVTMGVDFDLTAIRNLKFYGEFLIDDVTTSRLGTDFYGNKLAWLFGGYWVNLARVPNLDLRLEYARIRPYVYSHKRPISTYQHFTTLLGHPIGPNSDDFFTRLQYRFSRSLVFEANFDYQRWGANSDSLNVGREVTRDHAPQDAEEVAWLAGNRQYQTTICVEASYEFFRNLYLNGSYEYSHLTGTLNRADLKDSINRQQFWISVGLNY